MADNKKNDGTSGEFDDIDFEDFSDAEFDDTHAGEEAEFADLPEDDFSDENFADDDWQDDEDENPQVDKSLLTDGGKKGLSFNTIVMIGAFVVGAGVLALNIMMKSGEQSSEGSSIFQSMLNIGGVMDGEFFGEQEAEKTPEEIAAQEAQTQNEGFLNNPNAVIPSETPPQPTPIAPPEEAPTDNQPLTPMPADQAPALADGEMPRGPDEGTPESNVAVAELPADTQTPPSSTIEETKTETPSAEDILKQAMANRGQKGAATEDSAPEPAPETPELAAEPETIAEEAPGEVAIPPATETAAKPTPAPSSASEAPASSAAPEAVAENSKAVEALDSRMADLLERIDQIESELGTVKEAKETETAALEATVQSLKQEIAELKSRPQAAPAAKAAAREEEPEEEADVQPDEPKPAPKKASAPKPAAKTAATTPKVQTSSRWELRAAQPGRAWVSHPGERDMQSVEVGQSLQGIGRVTAILYQNGRWTVQGTNGQINQ